MLRVLSVDYPLFVAHVRAAFTRPTCYRFFVLVLAGLLTTGNYTVLNLLRTLGPLVPGDPSSYHRVFSKRRWSLWTVARILAEQIIGQFPVAGSIRLVGDDTVDAIAARRSSAKVAIAMPCVRPILYRLSLRSQVGGAGHLVSLPFASRPWALPILVAFVPQSGGRQKAGPPAQNAGAVDAANAQSHAAVGFPTAISSLPATAAMARTN